MSTAPPARAIAAVVTFAVVLAIAVVAIRVRSEASPSATDGDAASQASTQFVPPQGIEWRAVSIGETPYAPLLGQVKQTLARAYAGPPGTRDSSFDELAAFFTAERMAVSARTHFIRFEPSATSGLFARLFDAGAAPRMHGYFTVPECSEPWSSCSSPVIFLITTGWPTHWEIPEDAVLEVEGEDVRTLGGPAFMWMVFDSPATSDYTTRPAAPPPGTLRMDSWVAGTYDEVMTIAAGISSHLFTMLTDG